MAQFNKIQVLEAMQTTGLTPVFYHSDPATAESIVQACYIAGVRVFEFTNRGEMAHETFAQLLKSVRTSCPKMILGAGSIVDTATAALYIQSGANFIVGPAFNPDIAKTCNRRLVPYIAGCGTVTEISAAQEAGCDICKIFPADSVGGTSFVRSILAPMPWTMIMATGAVEPTEESLSEWFRAGVTCVGMGSKLLAVASVKSGYSETITSLCNKVLSIIKKYR